MHLHVHSNYSFLAGTMPILYLVELAAQRELSSLALTDTNNVTGMTEFYSRAREYGIKPIIGAEARDHHAKAVLLAKNWDGYQCINEILTRLVSHVPAARVTAGEEIPDEMREETSNVLAGIVRDQLTEDVFVLTQDESLLDAALERSPSGNVFLELTPQSEGRWPRLMETARLHNVDVVATNDVYFGDPRGYRLHSILRAISTNTTVGTLDAEELAHTSQYFLTEEEFERTFRDIPEALENRHRIAEECNVEFDFAHSKFTSFNGRSQKGKLEQLRSLTEEGFSKRYPAPTSSHRERVEKEFAIIRDLGFVDYFLVAWDVVRYAKNRNVPYVGRGSGANSIVAYCLEITNVDPIELDLFFERFLNPERRSPPDFDIDFSWRNRDAIIDYVLDKYGADRTAMICTISTFNPRGALFETGKALGYSQAEVKEFTSLLPSYFSSKDFIDPESPFNRHSGVVTKSRYGQEWMKIASRILEFPNHYGIHAGGVILAPEKMTRYTATQVAPKGVRITQQDMFSMEDWRLEKLDILSTRGLGTFEDTMKAVELRTGAMPPILDYKVACDDERTKEIMRTGKTIGCFYVESPAMIQLLKKLRADSFEMLTAASSVIRPGVSQSGMMQAFIERFHDPSKINPPHPMMAELLKSTFGVMVYQEDVIKVAHFIGGLSFGEADLLRRAMSGKMRSHDAMQKLRERFFEGCRRKDIHDKVTAEIWRQMESFAGYSFCKAHSASYAVLSFQEAYLKSHYPALFLCSVLNNQGGYYRPEVYIQEAKRLGIRVLLPNVNESEELNTNPDEKSIQLGFLHVKNLSTQSMNAILSSRAAEGKFASFPDFIRRGGATFEDVSILVQCGACDCFEEKRPAMMVEARLHFRNRRHRRLESELSLDYDLFEDELKTLRDYTPQRIAQLELETFSFTVTDHILDHFSEGLRGTVKAVDLEKHIGKNVSVGGWMIAAKMIRTRKGERMMFMNLDDSTGMIDVVLFPKCFREHAHELRTAGPYRVTGRVVKEFNVINLIADDLAVIK